MKLSSRYGLVGTGALALLSIVHWLRGRAVFGHPTVEYLLGVLPNFAAAIAIVFVLLSIWADQKPNARFETARRAYLICALISALGLLGWELLQKTSNRLVFDAHDIGATIVGIGFASTLFYMCTYKNHEDRER